MAKKQSRYKQMERYMTYVLLANAALFIFYLISAGNGIIWLKVITSFLTISISLLCLAYLYVSRELLRQRSLWMTAAAGAVFICTVASLLLRFPAASK